MMVLRAQRLASWVAGFCVLAVTPVDGARAQNLDAGKPASQIFAEVCANCHKSPREVRNNPSTSFLREHYTTGGEMASSMAAYLTASGGDPRAPGGQPKPKAPPGPVGAATPGSAAAAAREVPPPRVQTAPEPKPSAPAAPPSRVRPGAAAVTEAKPSPGAPPRPVLEDFEE
jgi:hypothetical protein